MIFVMSLQNTSELEAEVLQKGAKKRWVCQHRYFVGTSGLVSGVANHCRENLPDFEVEPLIADFWPRF